MKRNIRLAGTEFHGSRVSRVSKRSTSCVLLVLRPLLTFFRKGVAFAQEFRTFDTSGFFRFFFLSLLSSRRLVLSSILWLEFVSFSYSRGERKILVPWLRNFGNAPQQRHAITAVRSGFRGTLSVRRERRYPSEGTVITRKALGK